jgi:RNA polymerase sigma-70 factor (ECF subfamily)
LKSDEELVEMTLRGDKAAFDVLVRRYERMVVTTVLAIVRNPDLAADAAQESLVKSYVRLGRLRSPGKFGSWLNRIARNTARDFIRQRRMDSLTLDPVAEPTGSGCSELQDEQVRRAIALTGRLPGHERVVVELFYLKGMTVTQTAQTVGRTVGTVTKQLSRARRRLRHWMDGAINET